MKTESSTKVMKRIADYAGGHRHLITAGRIIAALSAFAAMVPFYDLWRTISPTRQSLPQHRSG